MEKNYPIPKQHPLISISFKYLDKNHDIFSKIFLERESYQAKYFEKVFDRFKNLSQLTRLELDNEQRKNPKTWRFHSIDWEETSQKRGFGFPKENDLVDIPYQFSVSSNEYGRIIGFFIGHIFYVVWLDHQHKLYPKR